MKKEMRQTTSSWQGSLLLLLQMIGEDTGEAGQWKVPVSVYIFWEEKAEKSEQIARREI